MSEAQQRTVFVVVDPAQDKPLALERVLSAAVVSPERTPEYFKSARLHIFIAVDCDNTDTSADNPAMHRDGRWFLENIVEPLEKSGLSFKLEMSWASDWYDSISLRAQQLKPDLIMLPMLQTPSERGRIFNESIWRLMRTAVCPVLVVRPNPVPEKTVILAAINALTHKPEYLELNKMIIERGQWMARVHEGELHIVTAYSDSLNYPDRSKLAQISDVETGNIHVNNGNPEEVIAEVAKEIGADVVVIGARNRASRWRGNTAERIITRVGCDILAING